MKRIGLLTEEKPQESPAAFVCPHCGKEYKSAPALKAYVTKEHSGQDFDSEISGGEPEETETV